MQFSAAVTTVTRTHIVKKVYDTVTKGSPGLMYFLQNAQPWRSGYKFEFPIQYQEKTNGGNTGIANSLPTDRENVRVTASFEPKMTAQNVVIADIEAILNEGDERIIDLFAAEFDASGKAMMNYMAANLWGGTGVGNDWDSLYNAADDATNFGTYGSLSRSTYPTWDGYYLAGTGALTLAKLATAYDAVTIGTDSPQIIGTTKALWSAYEALLTPTVRAGYNQSGYPKMNAWGFVPTSQALAGTQGFDVLFFRGTPIMRDEQIPSGKLFLINTNYFGMKGIDMSRKDNNISTLNFKTTNDGTPEGVPGRVPSTRGFNFRAMMPPVDQLAEIGYLVYAGNFISENPRLQGQLVGVTA